MQKYTVVPAVATHQRRHFKVLGSSPEQNVYEIRVKKDQVTALSAKLMTCGIWGKSTWTSAFFIFFLRFLLTYSYSGAEPCVQQAPKTEFLYYSDKKDEAKGADALLLFSVVELMEQTCILHWHWNTHPPPHHAYSASETLCTKAQVDT